MDDSIDAFINDLGDELPEIKNNIMKIMDRINQSQSNQQSNEQSNEQLDDMTNTFIKYASLANKIEAYNELITIVETPRYTSLLYNKSSSLIERIIIRSGKVLAFARKHINTIQNELNKKFIRIIKPCSTLDEFIKIRKLFYKYPLCINLYKIIAQETIDYLYEHDRKSIYTILQFLEDDKDHFLPDISNNYKSVIYDNQPPLKRFGLMPVCTSDTLSNILSKLLINVSGKIDLPKYAKKHNVAFIIFHSVVYTPLEYDLRNLYDIKIIEQLKQPAGTGVNDKIIEMFNTVKNININNANQKTKKNKTNRLKWSFKIETINYSADIQSFYIIETLDNETYRILAPWVSAEKNLIPRYKIEPLIKYIDEPHKPDRISKYQKICIDNATMNMFERIPLDLESSMERSKNVDTHVIRNKIYLEINKCIQDLIKHNIKTQSEINDIIHDTIIADELKHILYNMVKMANIDHSNINKGELLTSYLVDVNMTIRRFMKELHDGYNREPLAEISYNTVSKKLNELTLIITNMIFSENENIFASLRFKHILMTYQE